MSNFLLERCHAHSYAYQPPETATPDNCFDIFHFFFSLLIPLS